MNKESLSVLNYRNYANAVWDGNTSLQDKYKKIWLSTQNHSLEEGSLKKEYTIIIKNLLKNIDQESTRIEKKLLKQRFNFSSRINGRSYNYQELMALAKGEELQKRIRQDLLIETNLLIDSGFTELVRHRNNISGKQGFKNYWEMVNFPQHDIIRKFLIQLDFDFKKFPGNFLNPSRKTSLLIDLGEAIVFFASLLFVREEIPPLEVKIRKGVKCPPGPAYVQTIEYRPEEGHILGINLPFIHQNSLKSEDLGTLFHELTHLFHFASLDKRGSHAFPAELAANNLLYESEALCYQNLSLAAWKGDPYIPDLSMLKDLIYIGETERQLYSMETINSANIKKLIMRRIEEHYPDGNFIRTPLGASHLISGELAGHYWIYPAAHWRSFQRIENILNTEKRIILPSFWREGNEASFRLQMNLSKTEGNAYSTIPAQNHVDPQNLQRRKGEYIYGELERIGLYGKFLS